MGNISYKLPFSIVLVSLPEGIQDEIAMRYSGKPTQPWEITSFLGKTPYLYGHVSWDISILNRFNSQITMFHGKKITMFHGKSPFFMGKNHTFSASLTAIHSYPGIPRLLSPSAVTSRTAASDALLPNAPCQLETSWWTSPCWESSAARHGIG